MHNCSILIDYSNLANAENYLGLIIKSVEYELMTLRYICLALQSEPKPYCEISIANKLGRPGSTVAR
jgi:hypothetical protein